MKLKSYSLICLALLVGAVGCSSSGKTAENSAAPSAPDARQVYIEYVDKKLNRLQEESDKLKENNRKRVQTSIRDARIELTQLQNSTSPHWESYRSRLDGALAKIEREQFEYANKR